MFGKWCAMQSNQFCDSNLIRVIVTHNQLAEGILAGLCIPEAGTGQQLAHLHDRYMMIMMIMMTIFYTQTELSAVGIHIRP
jgi:hypothetical protein